MLVDLRHCRNALYAPVICAIVAIRGKMYQRCALLAAGLHSTNNVNTYAIMKVRT
jgi:hypothetical protein